MPCRNRPSTMNRKAKPGCCCCHSGKCPICGSDDIARDVRAEELERRPGYWLADICHKCGKHFNWREVSED